MVAKIRPSRIGKQSRQIRPTDISEDELVFNFKYLQLSHAKYSVDLQDGNYFRKFLERLLNISRCSISKLKSGNYGNSLRFHQIDFNEDRVSEKGFAGLPTHIESLAGDNAWQFSVSSNAHGRVHGFLIAPLFYVVWLDPDHNLYK